MNNTSIEIRWRPRESPLPARAVVAVGTAAAALGRRLAELSDDSLQALAAVAGKQLLVVVGDASALPWADGVTYLGRDEAAPDLLLPTVLEPTVPAAVLEAAVRRVIARPAPVAVLPAPARLISCGAARSIDRGRLVGWLEAQ